MVAFPEEIVQRAEELLPLFDARMKVSRSVTFCVRLTDLKRNVSLSNLFVC